MMIGDILTNLPKSPIHQTRPVVNQGRIAELRTDILMLIMYSKHLRIILWALFGYYGFLALMHPFVIAGENGVILSAVAGSSSLFFLFCRWVLHKGWVRPRYYHISFIPLGLIGLFNTYYHIWLIPDQIHLTNGALAVFAFGLMVISPQVYLFVSTLSVMMFITCLFVLEGPFTAHFAFLLVGAVAVASISFMQRYFTIRRQIELTIAEKKRSAQLKQLNRQIVEKKAEAEEKAQLANMANETKGQFLANTTHELRTPLTGVIGMLEILQETDLSPEQAKLARTAWLSARGLLRIINDVLDFSKLEAGKLDLDIRAFNPKELVGVIVEVLQIEAAGKNLITELEFPEEIFIVNGDSTRIGQILLNIIGNAIKFTNEGRITAGIHAVKKQNHIVFDFFVRDTGPGIAPDNLKHLFKRFEQLDTSATRRHVGTGLGLAISQDLARLMDGYISVESEIGKGSCFTLHITLEIAAQQIPTVDRFDAKSALEACPPNLRILIAEDNPVNIMLIKKFLKRDDWDVICVDNGFQAVETVKTDTSDFDVILMDIQMPEMGGEDAFKQIKALGGKKAQTPVIALTANTILSDVKRYESLGMFDVIGKPINREELYTALTVCLGDKS